MLMEAIAKYLAVRRASGFDLKGAAWTLASFARFAQSRGEEHVVADTAVAWASQAPSPPTRYKRLSDVRVLARYLRLEDPRNEIPPTGIFPGQVNRQTPYIFTEGEIRDLIGHASALGPEGSLRPLTYVTLFGLLAATGMRVGEALALRLDDLRSDHLRIRQAKFHKSRLVPLHTTTVSAMQRYLLRRRATGSVDPHVFLSLRRRKLSYGVTIETFHKVCEAARLPHRPSAHGLRLHDLRHTFAVRSLEDSPDGRDQVSQHTLALTTYMGHARVASTYWYLHSTPALMEDIADRCASLAERRDP